MNKEEENQGGNEVTNAKLSVGSSAPEIQGELKSKADD